MLRGAKKSSRKLVAGADGHEIRKTSRYLSNKTYVVFNID